MIPPLTCFHSAFIQHVGNMLVPRPHDDVGVGARDDLFDLFAGKNAALQKSSDHLLNSGPVLAHRPPPPHRPLQVAAVGRPSAASETTPCLLIGAEHNRTTGAADQEGGPVNPNSHSTNTLYQSLVRT